MSRTDVHRPYHVQQADPHERHRWYRFQTRSTGAPELVPTYRTCGCRACSGCRWHYTNRHDWRRQLRRDGDL